MKKYYILLIIMIGILLFFVSCATMQSRYNDTKEKNTIAAYLKFLEKYPEGELAIKAKENIECLENGFFGWIEAQSVNTIASYTNYIERYPNGKAVNQAIKKVDGLEWTEAKTINTISAYQKYLNKHPMGMHKSDADKIIQEIKLKIEKAKSLGYIAFCADHFQLYKNVYIIGSGFDKYNEIYLLYNFRDILPNYRWIYWKENNISSLEKIKELENKGIYIILHLGEIITEAFGYQQVSFYNYGTKQNVTIDSPPYESAECTVDIIISPDIKYSKNIKVNIKREYYGGGLTLSPEKLMNELMNAVVNYFNEVMSTGISK